VVTIFGTTYFTTGAGLVVLAIAAPLLFWFARWLWRPNVEDKPWRVRLLAVGGTTFGLLALLAVGLFWDVYLIGQRAKELCQETGLVVLKRLSTESLLGLTSIESYQAAGLQFVEREVGGKRYRFFMKDGKPHRELVAEFRSRFEVVSDTESASHEAGIIERSFTHQIESIVDRSNGEIVGVLRDTSIQPGWLDRLFFQVTGFTSRPWTCGRREDGNLVFGPERMTVSALVTSVIQNPNGPRRDRNGHHSNLPQSDIR
jgi:hypothetical protein